ncbi:cytochrome P450 [Pleomassaria siparia CBS 279.74]|uniref:Cytochrome P450 n=1 Tax=Pleomassaria siparia CBS 279.74 TaxID=1314801 RepID=A0A6G1JZY9_9PLEO|nr:cytochrome P450 [Pleomassaria siparia CBS 279.74]
MLAEIVACLVAWLAYRVIRYISSLAHHRKEALRSGLPVFHSWLHVSDTSYIFTHKLVASTTKWIPQEKLRSWFPWTVLLRVWHAGYEPFKYARSDSIMLTHASGNMLLTCDPGICEQIFDRSNDFKAPADTLFMYNIYGPTLAACEEQDWRRYRKVITPYFNTKTNTAVWEECLNQTEILTSTWTDNLGIINDIKRDVAAKLTIGVFAKVFFGKSIQTEDYEPKFDEVSRRERSFGGAILDVNNSLGIIVMLQAMPPWAKKLLPTSITRLGDVPYYELKRHMILLKDQVAQDLKDRAGSQEGFRTLLESVVSAGQTNTDKDPLSKTPALTEDEVFGNIFFLILAGYDTASTTISFAILLLALHPNYQHLLHEELDATLGQQKCHTVWNLRDDFQPLLTGFLGAVIKETLRLYNAVEWLPKRAMLDTTLTDSNGVPRFVQKGTLCVLDFAAMFRHPKYWPADTTTESDRDTTDDRMPPLQFDPTRWINDGAPTVRPAAYFPFGGGQRMCPGRKFAEILVGGILVRIFSEYTVEFVPSEADAREAHAKGHHGQDWVKEKTRERAARSLYEGIGFNHAIYPSKHAPIRFVKRG